MTHRRKGFILYFCMLLVAFIEGSLATTPSESPTPQGLTPLQRNLQEKLKERSQKKMAAESPSQQPKPQYHSNPGDALRESKRTIKEAQEKEMMSDKDYDPEEYEKQQRSIAQGQKLETAGKVVGKTFSVLTKTLQLLPQAISQIPDPHAKTVGVALSITLVAINILGQTTSQILLNVGRYKQRSQSFLSNSVNSILINNTLQSIRTYQQLEQELNDLLPPIPDENQSKTQKVVGVIKRAPSTILRKLHDTTDALYLTDKKSERGAKILLLQDSIKKAGETAEDNIRTLQIKLLQDSVKFIDGTLNKATKLKELDTFIEALTNEREQLKEALFQEKRLGRGEMNKIRDQVLAKDQKISELQAEHKALMDANEPRTVLVAYKEKLISQINEIVPLTKLGQSKYLQSKSFDESLSGKAGMVQILKKLDAFQEALCSLGNKTPKIIELCK